MNKRLKKLNKKAQLKKTMWVIITLIGIIVLIGLFLYFNDSNTIVNYLGEGRDKIVSNINYEDATWGNISLGSDAEIILLSVADDDFGNSSTQIDFSASANITGGSKIVNISLWHNGTGTFERNQTKHLSNITEFLVSEYKFDEGTGTLASDSIGSNDLTIPDSWTTSGKSGTASVQTGAGINSGFSLGDLHGDDEQITLVYWQNQTSSFPADDWIFETSTAENNGDIRFYFSGGLWRTTIFDSATEITGTSISPPSLNVWHQYVIQINNTAYRTYLDGVLKGSGSLNNFIWNANNLHIWERGDGTNDWDTNGRFDEFTIYNNSLSQLDIDNLFLGISPPEGLFELTNFSSTINSPTLWNVEVCDSDSVCAFAENNLTRNFKIFETNRTFNTATFETASETFTINVTANSSLTAAKLSFNGTNYTATQSGNVWSRTIDIQTGIGTRPFKWDFTYAGSTISSPSNDVTVSNTNFSICGGDGGDTIFLNISFQDEADLGQLNASIPLSTFTYYLGSGVITKELEYIETDNNFEYNFCATPNRTLNIIPNLQYKQGLIYPQRIWNPEVTSYTNVTTNQTLFLLNAIDGIFVTFQVVNSAEQPLSGVDITVVRSIGGSDFEVATGITTASGSQTFFLNPDFVHTFTFAKEGFTTFVDSFAPTQSSYTISLGGGVAFEAIDYSKGITYSIKPALTQLTNDTTYSFNLTLASSFWDVSQFGITLRLKNGSILQSTTANTNGGTLNLNQNTESFDSIVMDFFWVINSTQINNSRFWTVYNTEMTQWSMFRFFTDLTLYIDSGIFGLDDFGKHLIVFIVIFLSIGIMSFKYGLVSPMAISTLVFGLIYFFDVVIGLIPNPVGAIQNFPTIVAGITLVAIVIREVQK